LFTKQRIWVLKVWRATKAQGNEGKHEEKRLLMNADSETSTRAPDASDWSQLDRDVLCPLCEYNLRGLVEPRCPECGHQFTWIDLLDESRWHHPWLFEHQRKRRIRSFFRTFFTSLLPWIFWRSVQPTHKPKPRWLFCYWLILVFLTVLIVLAPYGQRFVEAFLSGLTLANSLTALADWDRETVRVFVPIGLMYVCWPGMTILVLMIFRQTMRQARIVPDHVVRCAVYSWDALILMALPLYFVARLAGSFRYSFSGWGLVGPVVSPPILLLLLISLGLLTLRLATAYRMYLRFPHAIATCILSQIVVGLAMFTAYLIWVTSRL
jgi:hypothetical protein